MKSIVVAGARSGIGKTTLAKKIAALLKDAVFVKIGHHPYKASKSDPLYPAGTNFKEICRDHPGVAYLIIESNSILNEMTPDCTIFLPADMPKPSATIAREKADIISGVRIDKNTLSDISLRLGISLDVMHRIIGFAGAIADTGEAV